MRKNDFTEEMKKGFPYPEILSIKFYKSSLYRLALKVRQILRTDKGKIFLAPFSDEKPLIDGGEGR